MWKILCGVPKFTIRRTSRKVLYKYILKYFEDNKSLENFNKKQ